MPRAGERLRLWREALPRPGRRSNRASTCRAWPAPRAFGRHHHERRALRRPCALVRGDGTLRSDDVEEGVRRELLKEDGLSEG